MSLNTAQSGVANLERGEHTLLLSKMSMTLASYVTISNKQGRNLTETIQLLFQHIQT